MKKIVSLFLILFCCPLQICFSMEEDDSKPLNEVAVLPMAYDGKNWQVLLHLNKNKDRWVPMRKKIPSKNNVGYDLIAPVLQEATGIEGASSAFHLKEEKPKYVLPQEQVPCCSYEMLGKGSWARLFHAIVPFYSARYISYVKAEGVDPWGEQDLETTLEPKDIRFAWIPAHFLLEKENITRKYMEEDVEVESNLYQAFAQGSTLWQKVSTYLETHQEKEPWKIFMPTQDSWQEASDLDENLWKLADTVLAEIAKKTELSDKEKLKEVEKLLKEKLEADEGALKQILLQPTVEGYVPLKYGTYTNNCYSSEDDYTYWGDGDLHEYKGQNMMGRLLMKIRAEYLYYPEDFSGLEIEQEANNNNEREEHIKKRAALLNPKILLFGAGAIGLVTLIYYLQQQGEEVTE